MVTWDMGAGTAAVRKMQVHAATEQQAMLLPDSVRINPIPKQVPGYPSLSSLFPLIQSLREELMYLKIKANGAFSPVSLRPTFILKLALCLLLCKFASPPWCSQQGPERCCQCCPASMMLELSSCSDPEHRIWGQILLESHCLCARVGGTQHWLQKTT